MTKSLQRFYRALLFLILVTVGCGLTVFTAFVRYGMVAHGATFSEALALAAHGQTLFMQLFMYGVGAGIGGLGYLHVVLMYLLFLRHVPNFWSRLPLYFAVLLATALVPAVFVATPATLIALPLIISPFCMWTVSAALFTWHNKPLSAPH